MVARAWSNWKRWMYRIWRWWIELPFFAAFAVVRLLYGFRLYGAEHLPSKGPVIVAIHEHSLMALLVSGYIAIRVMNRALDEGLSGFMGYMQEQLFALSVFRKLGQRQARERLGPLVPHSAGPLVMNLLDGYRVLNEGGMVIMNPEGDLPWDGRPLPLGGALAWLGLHSGAPIVPALCSPGAYDIWPRWRLLPRLRGHLTVTVGPPIVLTETPAKTSSEADIAAATARLRAEFDRLYYGPEGIAAWIGPPMQNGKPLDHVPPVAVLSPPSRNGAGEHTAAQPRGVSILRRGIGQVLWRCPVCHAEDTIWAHGGLWRKPTVYCSACGTQWALERCYEHDYRLRVTKGPQAIMGLEMGLAAWYDEMKAGFRPAPRPANGATWMPEEEVYLEATGVALQPQRVNPLFNGWQDREAPRTVPHGYHQLADWANAGEGRLVLTSHRLLWQGPGREIDFHWDGTTAVYLWLQNTLGIRYGAAPYRFRLANEAGLKWLTYAGTLSKEAAARAGRKLMTSDY
jgi:1-acyl-sn-glycerol-3-phosphate acyltransferase